MLKVIQILVHVVELFEMQKLEGYLKITRLKVVPNPKDRPIADKWHMLLDPANKFCLFAHSIEILLTD